MSAQIRIERKSYYKILEKIQKGNPDITGWIIWFIECLMHALLSTESVLSVVLKKAEFWQKHALTGINERQKLILNLLFDGFDGKLTTSKWAKITKCSADTALRDIQDLINKDILRKENAGGRSTHYDLK
jgi:Fic family protein